MYRPEVSRSAQTKNSTQLCVHTLAYPAIKARQSLRAMHQSYAAICLISTRKVPRHGLDFRVTASLKSQWSANAVLTENAWWSRLSTWTRLVGLGARLLTWKYQEVDRVILEEKSEHLLFKIVQESLFSEDIQVLTQSESVKTSSKLYRYNPFLDEEGILRVGGRWQQTTWDFEMKHLILLGRHYITQLLVRHYHKKHFHVGVDAMLAFLRHKYWIIGSRKIARSVKNSCVTCKRYDGRPCAEVTAPLPGSRVNLVRPFYACGIDYAGPLFARVTSQDISKVWIALFVCAQTRAVHLEVVTSLTTEDFILAFRRFAARRGQPYEIISDNAGMFKQAAKMLLIRWSFIPPTSPWFGGFYERLVKAVKAPLKKVLGRSMIWKKELETVLTEIEDLVNSRPLTCVSTEDAFSQPLTPAMLMGRTFDNSELQDSKERTLDLSRDDATKRFQHLLSIRTTTLVVDRLWFFRSFFIKSPTREFSRTLRQPLTCPNALSWPRSSKFEACPTMPCISLVFAGFSVPKNRRSSTNVRGQNWRSQIISSGLGRSSDEHRKIPRIRPPLPLSKKSNSCEWLVGVYAVFRTFAWRIQRPCCLWRLLSSFQSG